MYKDRLYFICQLTLSEDQRGAMALDCSSFSAEATALECVGFGCKASYTENNNNRYNGLGAMKSIYVIMV